MRFEIKMKKVKKKKQRSYSKKKRKKKVQLDESLPLLIIVSKNEKSINTFILFANDIVYF